MPALPFIFSSKQQQDIYEQKKISNVVQFQSWNSQIFWIMGKPIHSIVIVQIFKT